MKRIMVLLVIFLTLAGCSQPREKGVGAAIKEKQGKSPDTYQTIKENYVRSLTKLSAEAEKDSGPVAFTFLGMAKGVETRFEGDKSAEAAEIVTAFREAAKAIKPDNSKQTIEALIAELQ